MTPRCYNRDQFTDPNAGWRLTRYVVLRIAFDGYVIEKPVYRYRWPWFTDRCATWSGVGIGQPTEAYPTGTPYPIAHGFDCAGCRWLPEGAP